MEPKRPPLDYYGRPVKVGDSIYAMCWDSDGFPLWATAQTLTVVAVARTRVEVTGSFAGTIRVLSRCARIIERAGDAWPHPTHLLPGGVAR